MGALLSVHVHVDTLESEVRYLDGVMDETGSDFFAKNQTVTRFVPLDFGKSVVGHVTDTEARIFFRIHAPVTPGQVFVCEVIRDHLDSSTTTQQETQVNSDASQLNLGVVHLGLAASVQIDPDISRANTGVARIFGLQPGTRYRYTLYLRGNANADVAGSGRPRTPTYMILDDHDVVDDYGVKPSSEIVGGTQRESGALEAYETFQQSHGPDGPGVRLPPYRRVPASSVARKTTEEIKGESYTRPTGSSSPGAGDGRSI